MVKNAFTRAQNHTSRTTSIADAVNVPAQEPQERTPIRQEPARPAFQGRDVSRDMGRLRRSTVQFDEGTYLALKMAAAEHHAPMWAVMNEAIHAALLENRSFDWEHVHEIAARQADR